MQIMIWCALALYAAGAVATFYVNRRLIVGPINYPLDVLRNVLLWPVFLPWLLIISNKETR